MRLLNVTLIFGLWWFHTISKIRLYSYYGTGEHATSNYTFASLAYRNKSRQSRRLSRIRTSDGVFSTILMSIPSNSFRMDTFPKFDLKIIDLLIKNAINHWN